MKIELIYAQTPSGAIGYSGIHELPWSFPEDLKFFKATTQGKPMIMGSSTFDSLDRLLPGRFHYVVTSRKGLYKLGRMPALQFVPSVDEAIRLEEERGTESIIGIGGTSVIAELMGRADVIHRTIITGVKLDERRAKAIVPEIDTAMYKMVDQHHGEDKALIFERWER